MDAMESDSGVTLNELKVDGGMVANDLLMQFQADLLGVPVVRPAVTETTALGAAYLAGVGVGAWTVSDVAGSWRERRRYEPRMSDEERGMLLAGWEGALARARGTA
jgi:glycerol kinase